LALASALEELHNHVHVAHLNPHDETKAATASLFIVNPFSGRSLVNLLSTHPPVEKRIARLRNLFEKRNR
jgi:heat shock protein HtpX